MYKEYLIQKGTAIGLAYFGFNLVINPNWISVLFSVIGSVFVILFMLTNLHLKVKDRYKGSWKTWYKDVIWSKLKFWK